MPALRQRRNKRRKTGFFHAWKTLPNGNNPVSFSEAPSHAFAVLISIAPERPPFRGTTMNQPAASAAPTSNRFAMLDKLRVLPKPALMATAAALIALVVVAILWSRGPAYKVLFANLDERDGGAIVTALTQMNVPYRFADSGGALLVPADRVHETRLQLAGQGLPRGGSVGFELLDNTRFGASQFSEQITYQRGLEGELARSIEAMHTVQQARVHLALPRQTLFVRDRQAPTASVLLNLYPGRSLSDAQVSAVAWLVASSVPELQADNVSIVDQNGRLLSLPAGQQRGTDADQIRYVRDIEQRTVERILTLLNPLLGPGNVHAQATADVDFSQREQTSEVYRPNQEPGQAAVRSEQTSQASERGPRVAQGVPGALTNQPPVNAVAPLVNPPAANAANATNAATTPDATGAQQTVQTSLPGHERRDATINYEVDRTINHVKQSIGDLKRLSVAVVINHRPDSDGEMQPLPPEELTKLEQLVREAMGYSERRGDSLKLANSRFTDVDDSVPFWRDTEMIDFVKDLIGYLILGLALLWVWRAVVRPLVRRHVEPIIDAAVLDEAAAEANHVADEAARASQRKVYEDNLKTARDMALKNPRAVAMVLRSWIEKDAK